MARIDELRERLAELNAEGQAIQARAEAEKRDLTTEEAANLDSITAGFDRTRADIDRLDALAKQTDLLTKPQGRKTQPDGLVDVDDDETGDFQAKRRMETLGKNNEPRIIVKDRYQPQSKTGGFKNFGEFAHHVRLACLKGGSLDRRLEMLASASTYGNEGAGADGGFAVPPDFRTEIMQTIMAEDSLLSRCDQITVTGNSFTCPLDETTPWQTSGGIQVSWDAEAAAANQSKPQLGEATIKLHKLRALVPMTEEILEDAAALDSYLRRKAPDKIAFAVNLALIQGTGVGKPLGILNSPALITVAKESGQQANTIVANNIIKMYNRMYGPCRPRSVWVYNQEVEPQLWKMSLPGTDNTGNAVTGWGGMFYMAPNGLSQGPYGTLMGRPAIPTQACPALSSAGDICLVDFSQYLALLKSGPNPRVDISMHLWFDQDLTAYKFTLRIGGQPWWSTPASPLAGSNTYSPFVALGAR